MRYVVDSDVFITAKNRYYAFDICPGFWKSLIRRNAEGLLCSIDRVRGELLAGRDTEDLYRWVASVVPPDFFQSVDEPAIQQKFTEIMLWAQRSHIIDAAKAKFATSADGWLVAYAAVHGVIVVTNEQGAPNSRRELKLPDVCAAFGVTARDTFHMLRELGVQFDMTG